MPVSPITGRLVSPSAKRLRVIPHLRRPLPNCERTRVYEATRTTRHSRLRRAQHNDQPYLPRAADALMYAYSGPSKDESTELTGTAAANWEDASQRVIKSYRDWLRAVWIPRKLDWLFQRAGNIQARFRRHWISRADAKAQTPGPRDPDHVHPQHARFRHPDQDEAGVRAPPLRLEAQDRRRPHLQQPRRVPGACPLRTEGSKFGAKGTNELLQETLNFWKQVTHVLKYFRAEEDPKARLPKTFIDGFLEVYLNLCPSYAKLRTPC